MKKKNSKEILKSRKPREGDWAVINGGKDFKYALVCFKNETDFYWGQGHGYCTMLENYKVVEILGQFEPKDWDELEIHFLDKYHALEELNQWRVPVGFPQVVNFIRVILGVTGD